MFICIFGAVFALIGYRHKRPARPLSVLGLVFLYLRGCPPDTALIGPINGTRVASPSLPQLPFVVVVYRPLDGEYLVLQIPITDLSVRFIL